MSQIDLVVAGQILSAVSSNGHLSVVVGIIVVAVIGWVITTFGISIFHSYMRYAWLPQLIAISILYGVSASQFDLATPTSGDPRTRVGNRLSFFSLCFSAAITYAGGAADYFVYYPPSTPRLPLFFVSLLGLVFSFSFALIVGVGLASGVTTNAAYSAAYSNGQGNLLVEGFSSLHGFGKFLGVVIALGLIANTIFPTYSSGIDFQILGRTAQKVPRFIWNTFGVIIYTVCALAGRNHLSEIFTNFLALMGYWLAIWIAIILEEQIIFRRRTGYDWTIWNQQNKLPVGIAALIAFLVGWAGAILCMAQVWYIGPIAKQVGEYGADVCFGHLLMFQEKGPSCCSSRCALIYEADGQLRRFLMGCSCLPTSPMARAEKAGQVRNWICTTYHGCDFQEKRHLTEVLNAMCRPILLFISFIKGYSLKVSLPRARYKAASIFTYIERFKSAFLLSKRHKSLRLHKFGQSLWPGAT